MQFLMKKNTKFNCTLNTLIKNNINSTYPLNFLDESLKINDARIKAKLTKPYFELTASKRTISKLELISTVPFITFAFIPE